MSEEVVNFLQLLRNPSAKAIFSWLLNIAFAAQAVKSLVGTDVGISEIEDLRTDVIPELLIPVVNLDNIFI